MPFEVPESWEWCRLGELAFYKKGPFGSNLTKSMFVPKSSTTYKVYEQKNAINKDETLGTYFISESKFEELKGFEVFSNDIIVSCAGTIGETFILPDNIHRGIINQALMIIRLHDSRIQPFYLLYFDFILKDYAIKEGKGTAIKNIPPFEVLKNYFIPLPPFFEQQRIINEVERLFSLVKIIEDSKLKIEHFISQTKSKVLDLAMRGKLVPQDPNDDPASALLEQIRKEQKLPKKTADKFQNKQLPKGWINVCLEDIFKITMGQSPVGESISNKSEGVEFHQGKINFTDKYLAKSKLFTVKPTKVIDKPSVLLCVRAPVGVVNISRNIVCIGRGLCAVTPLKNISIDFTYYWLKTLEKSFIKKSTGSTFQSISMNTVRKSVIPLPPLPEQQRIVDKIEEIFKMLDKIQENIQTNT